MKKVIVYTFSGISSIIFGVYLLYNYFTSLNNGGNPLLLLLSLFLLGFGSVLLFRGTGVNNNTSDTENQSSLNDESSESLIDRNNKLAEDYGKTLESHSKLKLLKLRADELDKKNPFGS